MINFIITVTPYLIGASIIVALVDLALFALIKLGESNELY